MTPWLEIDAGADGGQVNLVRPGSAAPPGRDGMTLPLLAGLSSIQRPLSIPGIAAAPVSNMDATLDNAGGQLTRLWGQCPPVRRAVRVATQAGVLFDGIAVGLQLGGEVRMSLEAGADRPLSDNVPLRTSAVWGGWRDVKVLPWAWGHVTLTPIQYSDDQRVFFLADHPVQGVDEVKRDDVATDAWAFYNGVDSTGRAVAFVELAMPLADGERLAVRLRGRMHPDTGRLLQTPAEILHDVLANLARAPVQWADLDDYRTETAHVVLGGLLADNSISIRAAVDGLLQSCGGAWAAAMPGVAITWPPLPDDAAPALRVDKLTAQGLQASTTAAGLHTAVRVLYDYDHAAQRYRRAIQLQAPEAVKDFGLLELEWPAPWLRTPRQAEELGQRVLGWLAANPRYRLQGSALAVATIIVGAVLGVLVTVSSIGAGAVGATLILILYPELKSAEVAGTDIAYAVPLTAVAGLGHMYLGTIDWNLLVSLLVGSIPGIWLGARLSKNLPERLVRGALAATLTVTAIKLVS